jgi:hypothetical protein
MPSKKRTASPSPAPNASKSQDALYAKLFDQLDTDHSGYLDFDELYAALVSHHNAPKHITPQVVMNMMDEADIDGNGLIDLKEFISIMKNARDSKYWKTTSDSLWGSFGASVRNAASIAEQVLQPVHEAVAMHAHPHLTAGTLKEMSPTPIVRIFGAIIASMAGSFLAFYVPCFAWPRGKTLSGFLFGFHFRKNGKVCSWGQILLLNLFHAFTIFGCFTTLFLTVFPSLSSLLVEAQSADCRNSHRCPVKDNMAAVFFANYLFAIFLLVALHAANVICFFVTKRNQTIWEWLLGYEACVDMHDQ